MRDRGKRVAGKCRDGARWTIGKLWRGFVFVISREKVIQAGITSIFFGIIAAMSEGTGIYLSQLIEQGTGLYVPAKFSMVPLLVVLLGVFLWADRYTDEWRDLIADATGQEEAVEAAEEADEEAEEEGED